MLGPGMQWGWGHSPRTVEDVQPSVMDCARVPWPSGAGGSHPGRGCGGSGGLEGLGGLPGLALGGGEVLELLGPLLEKGWGAPETQRCSACPRGPPACVLPGPPRPPVAVAGSLITGPAALGFLILSAPPGASPLCCSCLSCPSHDGEGGLGHRQAQSGHGEH